MDRNVKLNVRKDGCIDGMSFDVTPDEILKLWIDGSVNNVDGWEELTLFNIRQIIRDKFSNPGQRLFATPKEVFVDSNYVLKDLSDEKFVGCILTGTDSNLRRIDASSEEYGSKFRLENSKVFHNETYFTGEGEPEFKMGLTSEHDVDYMKNLLEYLTFKSERVAYIGKVETEWAEGENSTVFVNLVSYTTSSGGVLIVKYKVEINLPFNTDMDREEFSDEIKGLLTMILGFKEVYEELCKLPLQPNESKDEED